MPVYQLTLLDRKEIARDTLMFTLEKPEGFQFKPGQYGGFTLINPTETDAGGHTRRFSLLSSPNDKDLHIAMRFQPSAFKRVLKELPLGSKIKFAGPTGNFILHDDETTPAVLIAGGIGITPFYSMIKHTTQQKTPRKITLFYGNQSIEDVALMNELLKCERENPNFTLVSVLVNPPPHWQGETGFVSHATLKKHIPDLAKPIFYICGSLNMVNALHETLHELDINEERIKVEDFPGY